MSTDPFISAGRQPAPDKMVEEQVCARGITDTNVIRAMRRIPRHLFVQAEHRAHAYRDGPLPIGGGQTISQPFMVAIMTQLLALKPGDRALEIGTGSGYQAAILSQIAREVVSIERHPELTAFARANIDALGIKNVTLITGDGSEGYPNAAPYEGIIVTAGAPEVPAALIAQLAEGGRLVCPAGSRDEQILKRIHRRGGKLYVKKGVPCMFVPLIGSQGWEEQDNG